MSPQATGTRPRTTLTEQPGSSAPADGTRVPAPRGPVDTAAPCPVVTVRSETAASTPPGPARTGQPPAPRHTPDGTGPEGTGGRAGTVPEGAGGVDGTGTPAPGPVRAALARLGSPKVRTHLGTLAGIVILGVLFWRLGTGVFLDGLRRIDGVSLLLALGIGLVTTVCSAWRWAIVARGLRIRLPFGPAVADYYRALFLNAALPGGILGDVHRAVRHGQSEGDLRRGVKAVVLERTAGQLALFAAGAVVLLTMPSPALAQARRIAPLAALTALGALAVVVALRMNRAAPSPRGRKLRAFLAEAREGLLSRRNGPGVVVSSVVVLAGYVAMFVLAARVAGTAASVAVLLPLAVLALLAMSLPLNVGGWGPREGVTAWAFGAAGLGAGRGLAVAVVYGVLSLVASLPGLIVLVARWSAGLRAGDRTAPAVSAPQGDYASEVSSEKYAPKESARLARSSFPFSAEPSEGRPMTPESV
ncbi:lysylphosphatidylglycerol synthase domain-containing protein [Streptomyces tibetensis]|uniref:lysylphosphatidylglycerol synthase transmembrane domain-containing protein n=1 Tax=Streptomyces tibetensis TaxID=2382123 RepID=UPI003F541ACD